MRSRSIIEERVGVAPRYFAYPGGKCNRQTHAIALDCGFESLFTSEPVYVTNRRVVGRLGIERGQGQGWLGATLAKQVWSGALLGRAVFRLLDRHQ